MGGNRELLSWGSRFTLGDAPNGLADSFFLGGIAQTKFSKALHQFVIGRIKFEGMQKSLSTIREMLLLQVDFAQMLINHRIVADQRHRPLHFHHGFGQ